MLPDALILVQEPQPPSKKVDIMSAEFEVFSQSETLDHARKIVKSALDLRDGHGRTLSGRATVAALLNAATTVLSDSTQAAGTPFEVFSVAEIDRLLQAMRRRVVQSGGAR